MQTRAPALNQCNSNDTPLCRRERTNYKSMEFNQRKDVQNSAYDRAGLLMTRAARECNCFYQSVKIPNQRQIIGILWYELVTNVEVATLSQLPSTNEAVSRRRHSLFGHVRSMDEAAPAHKALHLSVTSRQGSGQCGTWRRQPSRPRKCWVKQVTTSTGLSPSDAWIVATDRSA